MIMCGTVIEQCGCSYDTVFTQSLKVSFVVSPCVCVQERGGVSKFTHDKLLLQFKLDNEFELTFVVCVCVCVCVCVTVCSHYSFGIHNR